MDLKYDSMKDFIIFWETAHMLHEFNVLLREFIDKKESFNKKKAERLLFLTQEYKYDVLDFIDKLSEAFGRDTYKLISEKEFYLLEGRLMAYIEEQE